MPRIALLPKRPIDGNDGEESFCELSRLGAGGESKTVLPLSSEPMRGLQGVEVGYQPRNDGMEAIRPEAGLRVNDCRLTVGDLPVFLLQVCGW